MAEQAEVADVVKALRRYADELHETVAGLYAELDKLAEFTQQDEEAEGERPRG